MLRELRSVLGDSFDRRAEVRVAPFKVGRHDLEELDRCVTFFVAKFIAHAKSIAFILSPVKTHPLF